MRLIAQPFFHGVEDCFFKPEALVLLQRFINSAKWAFFDDDRFPQYISDRKQVEEFLLNNKDGRRELGHLLSRRYLKKIGSLFNLRLTACTAVSFHRLTAGCYNPTHNDSNAIGEKIRVVCYLSEPTSYSGGELNLYAQPNQDKPTMSYKLGPNSAFIFPMNSSSIHSVSEVISGERICLVLTYS